MQTYEFSPIETPPPVQHPHRPLVLAIAISAMLGIAGGAIGDIVGRLVGKGIAEKIEPTREDAYWRENHSRQGWAKGRRFEDFQPAYRNGYEGYAKYGEAGTFEEREAELRRQYEGTQAALPWDEVRPASRAAWTRAPTPPGDTPSLPEVHNPSTAWEPRLGLGAPLQVLPIAQFEPSKSGSVLLS